MSIERGRQPMNNPLRTSTRPALAVHRLRVSLFVIALGLAVSLAPACLAQQTLQAFNIPNPAPSVGDGFGYSLAFVGSNHFVIGAPFDDTSASDSGAVY